MLDGMHFCCIHNRLRIGAGHTQIKGRNNIRPYGILSGNIQTGQQPNMINGKACDFLNEYRSSLAEL